MRLQNIVLEVKNVTMTAGDTEIKVDSIAPSARGHAELVVLAGGCVCTFRAAAVRSVLGERGGLAEAFDHLAFRLDDGVQFRGRRNLSEEFNLR